VFAERGYERFPPPTLPGPQPEREGPVEVRDRLFIGNEWVEPATSATIDVISPTTEEVYARTPDASPADIDRAVAAARDAFDNGPWPDTTPEERADAITALSQALQKRAAQIAEVVTNENGTPAQQSIMTQVYAATMVLDTYADITRTYTWSDERTGAMGQKVLVRRAPVGVCAGITPWNVPLFIMAMKLGPCLASGSTMVLKPAPETALDPYLLAEAVLDAGLPPGVVNIVAATREASEYIVTHPGIDKVSFTGSTATGSRIGELCGAQIKRVTLELGGKSAAIVLDDVDIEAHLSNLIMSGLLNNGQACAAQTRILAPRSRYKELVDALAAGVGAMPFGDPTDPTTAIGPVVAERQRDKIVGLLESGKEQGAKVALGGGRPSHLEKGWFIEPTVFYDVDNSMRIAREEIFGPVLSVVRADTVDEAIALINANPYGNGTAIFTSSGEAARRFQRGVTVGMIGINVPIPVPMAYYSFGGWKDSLFGQSHIHGPEGIAFYTRAKVVTSRWPQVAAASGSSFHFPTAT
jgi:aldehyde dehydrogenase (NAD+)